MKSKMKFCFFTSLLWSFVNLIQGQEVVTATGGYGTTSTAKVTWTIGEPVTETRTGATAALTQGFNQGDLLISAIKEPEDSGLILNVYPNPADEYIRISTGKRETGELKYILFDFGGKVLTDKFIYGTETEISVSDLSPSTYFLKVYLGKKAIGVYKIIKK